MTCSLAATDMVKLADLVKARNAVDAEITAIINRPAAIGHLGEFIAAEVFGIILEKSASAKHIDGRFAFGPLAGRSVNIKWYAKMQSALDLHPTGGPDYYLVLAGPKGDAVSSRDQVRPMLIESVYLFEACPLVEALRARPVKVGTATSIFQALWETAEIFPTPRNPTLVLAPEQRQALTLFGATQAITIATTPSTER